MLEERYIELFIKGIPLLITLVPIVLSVITIFTSREVETLLYTKERRVLRKILISGSLLFGLALFQTSATELTASLIEQFNNVETLIAIFTMILFFTAVIYNLLMYGFVILCSTEIKVLRPFAIKIYNNHFVQKILGSSLPFGAVLSVITLLLFNGIVLYYSRASVGQVNANLISTYAFFYFLIVMVIINLRNAASLFQTQIYQVTIYMKDNKKFENVYIYYPSNRNTLLLGDAPNIDDATQFVTVSKNDIGYIVYDKIVERWSLFKEEDPSSNRS